MYVYKAMSMYSRRDMYVFKAICMYTRRCRCIDVTDCVAQAPTMPRAYSCVCGYTRRYVCIRVTKCVVQLRTMYMRHMRACILAHVWLYKAICIWELRTLFTKPHELSM